MKSPQSKGKLLEGFVVTQLRESGLDPQAYRQAGSGNGLRKGDIWNDLGICFECKNTDQPNLGPTMKQVRREAMNYQEPVIVWHPPQLPLEDSVVIINWSYFRSLLEAKKNHNQTDEILDRFQVKNNLEKAVYHLKKVIKNV